MNHTSSHSKMTYKSINFWSNTIAAVVLTSLLIGVIVMLYRLPERRAAMPISENMACSRLNAYMLYYQNMSVYSSNEEDELYYPSIENSQLIRRTYQGEDNFGMCTARVRQPNREENLYTMIIARGNNIVLSLENNGEDSVNCEPEPPLNPNCNVFGSYNYHFFFVEAQP